MPGFRSFAALVAAFAVLASAAHGAPPGLGNHQHHQKLHKRATVTSTIHSTTTVVYDGRAPIREPTFWHSHPAAGSSSSTSSASKSSSVASIYSSSASVSSSSASKSSASASISSANATTSVTAYPTSTGTTTTTPAKLRGVNIGGWLVLEKWMNSDVFSGTNATDQYSFDETTGAEAKLQAHWESYFNETDVATIASWGINALRIPIGYWAYNNSGTPYISGADAYMEKAIGWARAYGLKVLVDCHGSPGSQNGFDNSGRAGDVSWQSGDNLQLSIDVLETMAAKYGAEEYADVVFGLELVNEPISWSPNNFTLSKQWAQEATAAVKAKATNPDLMVIMHDGFMGPSNWARTGLAVNGNATNANAKFAVDIHLYQNQVAADSLLNQAQHIAKACNWTQSELLPANSSLPVYVGEFSAATNICVNPDGTTLAGSTCTVSGCQCADTVSIQYWNSPLVQATRKFLEAELDAFEHSSRGWFMWSYKGPGAWGMTNAVKYGLIGAKVTDRMFPNQCNSTSS
ncbi:hypothetical protein LTR85_006615 [Meristemomyces frigidus]|nr:hypothetical protein LTR85_006615 [Meristemomyces frigidus]